MPYFPTFVVGGSLVRELVRSIGLLVACGCGLWAASAVVASGDAGAQAGPSTPPSESPASEPEGDAQKSAEEAADADGVGEADLPDEAPPADEDDADADDTSAADSEDGEDLDDDTGGLLNDLLSDFEDSSGEAWGEAADTGPVYPYVEHEGVFRFRADMFYRGHLGTVGRRDDGSSITSGGFLPPLSRNELNSDDSSQLDGDAKGEDAVAGANIRFRYSPTIHIQDWLRIHTTLDILDNVVLGSTPDYSPYRPDAPLAFFAGGQAPPSDLRNAFTDSVRVKEAFGEVQTPFGNLRFGRMANHWGLGILANGGTHIDSDFGDFVDRIVLTSHLWDTYFSIAWDFMSEGLLAVDQNQYFGQPYDATQLDDVIQVVFAVYQRPQTDQEIDERRRMLNEDRKAAFDWGTYVVFRQQEYDVAAANQPSYAPTVFDAATGQYRPNTVTRNTFDDFGLVRRGAWTLIPDFWAKLEWMPTYRDRLRIEFEAVFMYGQMDRAVDSLSRLDNGVVVDAAAVDAEKTIVQWGGVLQGEYQRGGLTVNLEIGAASGDPSPHLGVLDQPNYATGAQPLPAQPNKKLTNFMFDRNYYVDLLMFREVIGAVTNAVYVKPGIQYDLFGGVTDSLGGRVDIISGWALEPDATPGRSSWYGIEFDAQIFYEEKNRFRADLSWGTLVPGDAFDLPEGYLGATSAIGAADFAMTVQGRFFLMF